MPRVLGGPSSDMNQDSPTVVALGELLWDLFPDGPRFGGAPGNFAHHAAALDAQVSMVSAVGNDELGRQAIASLQASGIDVQQVAVSPSRPTGSVAVTLDDQGHASYQFHQDEAWDFLDWTDSLRELASRCDAVCFGTLGQRSSGSRETIQKFVSATREPALRVLDINLRAPHYSHEVIDRSLELANVLKLNDDELRYLAERFGQADLSQVDQAQAIRRRCDLRLVAVTKGSAGALLVSEEEVVESPGAAVEVRDTVGAGDSFTAALVVGLLREIDLATVAASACRIAEYVCTQSGATPPLPTSIFH